MGTCQAAILLDTGPGPTSGDAWFLDSIHNAVAGKFTTTKAWNISSIQVWMQLDTGGTARAAIYNDNGGGEVPGSIRFSQNFTATANSVANWQGASSLTWSLPPGTYWLGFQVETPGLNGVLYYPAPYPLETYAYRIIDNPWSQYNFNLGLRIQGSKVTGSLGGIGLLLMD
jgi:hypothetical protein